MPNEYQSKKVITRVTSGRIKDLRDGIKRYKTLIAQSEYPAMKAAYQEKINELADEIRKIEKANE